jgi:predicted anti-sigma-YlaC factor YlaD
VQCCGHRVASAGDTRPDRADRATDDVRGVGVGQAEQLGEHERFALVERQAGQQLAGLDRAVRVWGWQQWWFRTRTGAAPCSFPDVFEAHVAGDAEDPGVHRAALPTVEVGDDAQQGLLGQVVGLVQAGEVGAEPPHVGLDRPHERVERLAVAGLRRRGETVEIEHHTIVSSPTGTSGTSDVTRGVVDCEQAREVLSAQLDQEASPTEAAAANAHLGHCPGCRDWWSDIGALNRVLRVRVAEPVPDVATGVLGQAHPPRAGRGQWVRIALAVVAATELVLAAPGLVLGDGASSIHDARHLGSFGAAVSIGLLYVAARPARAYGILPIVTALALTMFVTATIDIATGRANSLGEAHHLLEISGLVLVWMLAGRPAPRRLKPLVDPSHPAHRLRHL